MPIRYQDRDWEFEKLAEHIAAQKGWDMERARGYVAGIEKQQQDQGENRRRSRKR